MTNTTNLPTVQVRPPQGGGSADSGFWGASIAVTTGADFAGPLSDHEGPIEDVADPEFDAAYQFLSWNPYFLKLPQNVQSIVLSDKALAKQVTDFLQGGGMIMIVPNMNSQAEFENGIVKIRQDLIDSAASDWDSARYAATLFIHEVGHSLETRPYQSGSPDQTAEWYLHGEVLAGLYQLLHWHISRGETGVTAGDYNDGYTAMYLNFMSHGNLDQLLNEMKAQFRQRRPDQMNYWRSLYQP